ncbi:MAG: hypothetical protein D6816_03130 [Bacteroidetes bacterium]|nr:MAG: hypothetical protein D6816_03130 [Bacteroidota bacterium]
MKLVFNHQNLRALLLVALAMVVTIGTTSADNPFSTRQNAIENGSLEFARTITKDFPINSDGTVSLANKYGKVEVKTWDKSRVKIEVTIVVKAKSESNANEIFDRIDIDFTNSSDYVSAETRIEPQKSSWFDWSGSDKAEFQINYEVFMPVSCALSLRNKYGDSFVEPIAGKTSVDIKYGNIRLEGVNNSLNIVLGYGNGTVVKARNINADLGYGKLNVSDADDISLVSKYSKITIDNADLITGESKYDNIVLGKVKKMNLLAKYGDVEIREANELDATAKYTDFKVHELKDGGVFEFQYGGLLVDKLAKGFSSMDLKGKYTDFKIYVEPGASYVLDASTNYAGIAYPAGLNVTYEKDKGTSQAVKGHVGTSGARSVIRANLEYGGLKVRQ